MSIMKIYPASGSLCVTLAAGVALSGCNVAVAPLRPFAGHQTWSRTDPEDVNHFKGTPQLTAIAPNIFLFTQPEAKEKKFSFHSEKHGTITPETMVTNGSSVPRILWPVKGLGSWDFARAAVIHDWIFEAHHRYEIAKKGHEAALTAGDRVALKSTEEEMKRYEQWGDDSKFHDAADIMAECIREEMRFCSAASHVIEDRIKAPQASSEPFYSGNTQAALKETRKDFQIGAESKSNLGFYRWAIGSPLARKVWAAPKGHRSSVTTVRALKDKLETAVNYGFIDASSQAKLMELIRTEEKREEEVGKANLAKSIQSDVKMSKQDLNGIILRVNRGEIINIGGVYLSGNADAVDGIMARLKDELDAYLRSPHVVNRVPDQVTEVRYYYTDDKAEAEKIKGRLMSLTGLSGQKIRVSYVIDADIKARRTYQIAFARDAFSAAKVSRPVFSEIPPQR